MPVESLPNPLLELIWSHFNVDIQCAVANLVSRRWRHLVKRGPMYVWRQSESTDRFEPCRVLSDGKLKVPSNFSPSQITVLRLTGLYADWTLRCTGLRHLELSELCNRNLKALIRAEVDMRLETLRISWGRVEAVPLLTFLLKATVHALYLNRTSVDLPSVHCPDLRVLLLTGSAHQGDFLRANPQLVKFAASTTPSADLLPFAAMEHAEVPPLLLSALVGPALRCLQVDFSKCEQVRVRDGTALIATCRALAVLDISSRALRSTDLDPLVRLPVLESLTLQTIREHHFEGLDGLSALKHLHIICMPSPSHDPVNLVRLPPSLQQLRIVCPSVYFKHDFPASLRTLGLEGHLHEPVGANLVEELYSSHWSDRLLELFPFVHVVSWNYLPMGICVATSRPVKTVARAWEPQFPSLETWFRSRQWNRELEELS